MKTKVVRTATIVVLLVVSLMLPVQAGPPGQGPSPRPPGPIDEALVGQLQQETGDETRISYHAETGKVRFIGTSPERPITQPAILADGASPEAAARGFLDTYGQLFGLTDQGQELAVMRSKTVDRGRSFVRFQQVYQGIPVLGGELIVQLDANKDVASANGEVLPDPALDTTPAIEAETARQIALAAVAKDYGLSASELRASEPELWIYNPMLMGVPGPRFSALAWRMDVEPKELLPIRELVLVDAHLGAVALHFNQIDTARNRLTYDANNGTTLPGTLRCNESNPNCTGGDSHEVAAHVYAGDTYDFYSAEHGRDSIDNAGMTLISTVHYGSSYDNAFWNGSQMVYGDAYGFPLADDVVAHELTHGVTDYESGLFYFYQSGAINESFSDVWGEFVDQEQATGNDAGDTRWALGEDVSGLGALRNMQDPTLFGDPDKMTSTNYFCEQSQLGSPYGDNGGVHSNNGVGNKAAYLMTDGDSFNGYTVTGLGYAKVADLYYEVQTNLLTSAADYADLYDALIQACSNLGYSAGDCQEVKDAVDATEMNQQPTTCAATEAPICDSGSPTNLFFDDIESGSGNWTAGSNSGTIYWFVPQTTETLGLPGPYATSGVGNIWGFDQGDPIGGTSDTFLAMNSDVALPANAYMHFNHSFGFESTWPTGSTRYDGGILEYSTNGGSSWTNAGSLITHNGYNGTLHSGNPLGAISAFSADSRGYISSRLDLSSLAGQNVRFRFRIGTDSTVYDFGWFIDDVRIYTCLPALSPTCPFYDGFESGTLGAGWTTYTTNEGRVRVSSSYPYAGTYSVLLDDSTGNSTYSTAALILTTDLSGKCEVDLSFWWREFGDENHPDDGVFLSDDNGASWTDAVLSFNNGPSSYRNDVIDIDAAAAANGLTLNDHFQIKFQFYDDYPIPTDGYAIDEVQLSCGGGGNIYLPIILKGDSPSGPTPGFWRDDGWNMEFYVTPDRAYVDDFAIYVYVSGCGDYKITYTPLEPISNNQFSFSGSFYASGTFSSSTTASGTTGLDNLYIPGCGYVDGGPWAWDATWRSSDQPLQAELVEPTTIEAADDLRGTHIFFDAVQAR